MLESTDTVTVDLTADEIAMGVRIDDVLPGETGYQSFVPWTNADGSVYYPTALYSSLINVYVQYVVASKEGTPKTRAAYINLFVTLLNAFATNTMQTYVQQNINDLAWYWSIVHYTYVVEWGAAAFSLMEAFRANLDAPRRELGHYAPHYSLYGDDLFTNPEFVFGLGVSIHSGGSWQFNPGTFNEMVFKVVFSQPIVLDLGHNWEIGMVIYVAHNVSTAATVWNMFSLLIDGVTKNFTVSTPNEYMGSQSLFTGPAISTSLPDVAMIGNTWYTLTISNESLSSTTGIITHKVEGTVGHTGEDVSGIVHSETTSGNPVTLSEIAFNKSPLTVWMKELWVQ